MKKRIVMALALAGLIGAIVVNKIKPEQVQDRVASLNDSTEFVQSGSPILDTPKAPEIKIVPETGLVEETTLPEACIIIPSGQMPVDGGVLIKETASPASDSIIPVQRKLEEEKVIEAEKALPITIETPELTSSVEATPLPPVHVAPEVTRSEPATTGRFGGGKFL